jgi:hypothetical protein
MRESTLKYRKVLQNCLRQGTLTKKEVKKELKWIKNNIKIKK